MERSNYRPPRAEEPCGHRRSSAAVRRPPLPFCGGGCRGRRRNPCLFRAPGADPIVPQKTGFSGNDSRAVYVIAFDISFFQMRYYYTKGRHFHICRTAADFACLRNKAPPIFTFSVGGGGGGRHSGDGRPSDFRGLLTRGGEAPDLLIFITDFRECCCCCTGCSRVRAGLRLMSFLFLFYFSADFLTALVIACFFPLSRFRWKAGETE